MPSAERASCLLFGRIESPRHRVLRSVVGVVVVSGGV